MALWHEDSWKIYGYVGIFFIDLKVAMCEIFPPPKGGVWA